MKMAVMVAIQMMRTATIEQPQKCFHFTFRARFCCNGGAGCRSGCCCFGSTAAGTAVYSAAAGASLVFGSKALAVSSVHRDAACSVLGYLF
jgi:hypothetical protein